jgi:uncharacterized YigZ family protein
MSPFSYRTINKSAEGLFKDKGSKFMAFAFPVISEAEIREQLSGLKKQYFDARHHCFAWILGAEKNTFRAFDDGEPNHSAGDPILGQIRSKDLTNVLVVVVRYFGGVKLGVGGLITAYKKAAEDALQHAEIIEKQVTGMIEIDYEYASTAEVMRAVNEFDLVIQSQKFETGCFLLAQYALRDKEKLFERMRVMKVMGVKVDFREV